VVSVEDYEKIARGELTIDDLCLTDTRTLAKELADSGLDIGTQTERCMAALRQQMGCEERRARNN
jgi:hypothetical protein